MKSPSPPASPEPLTLPLRTVPKILSEAAVLDTLLLINLLSCILRVK